MKKYLAALFAAAALLGFGFAAAAPASASVSCPNMHYETPCH